MYIKNKHTKNKENIFHLTVQYLEKYSSTSYITSAFTLASGHPGLEIKILYSIQYCTMKYTKAQPLAEDAHM